MFYAARNGSSAGSATEGEKKGEITGSTVICRYDRFVDLMSGLPADAARRCDRLLSRWLDVSAVQPLFGASCSSVTKLIWLCSVACLCDGFIRALEEPTLKMSYRDELWNTHKGARVLLGCLVGVTAGSVVWMGVLA